MLTFEIILIAFQLVQWQVKQGGKRRKRKWNGNGNEQDQCIRRGAHYSQPLDLVAPDGPYACIGCLEDLKLPGFLCGIHYLHDVLNWTARICCTFVSTLDGWWKDTNSFRERAAGGASPSN